MDLFSTIVSCLALAVSGVAAVRTDRRAGRAERRAQRAEERAEQAEANAERARLAQLWADLIRHMQRMVTLNVLAEDVKGPLTDVRTAAVALVDGAPRDDWPGLDAWLQAEHTLGTLLARSTLDGLARHPSPDIDAVSDAHRPLNEWAAVHLQNIRRMRNIGAGAEARDALPDLLGHAQRRIKTVCEQNGYDIPGLVKNIKPLRES